MATALNDLANGVECATALHPDTYDAPTSGPAVDMTGGDEAGFAVLTVGPIAAGTQVGGYVEECDDGQDWTDVPLASFAPVTTADAVRVVSFRRTARYMRAVLMVTGAGSPQAAAAVTIGQQRKLV